MKRIKPIALNGAKILSNEEMKHLFGGSAVTLTCTFSCKGGESVTASGCVSCKATDNGGYCVYPTGSTTLLLCQSGSTGGSVMPSGTGPSGTGPSGFINV